MDLHLGTNCLGAWTKYVFFLYLGHWWLDWRRNRFYWLCRPWEQWDFWLSGSGSHFAWTTQRSLYHHTSWRKYHVYRYLQRSSKWPFGALQKWPRTPVWSFWFQVAWEEEEGILNVDHIIRQHRFGQQIQTLHSHQISMRKLVLSSTVRNITTDLLSWLWVEKI